MYVCKLSAAPSGTLPTGEHFRAVPINTTLFSVHARVRALLSGHARRHGRPRPLGYAAQAHAHLRRTARVPPDRAAPESPPPRRAHLHAHFQGNRTVPEQVLVQCEPCCQHARITVSACGTIDTAPPPRHTSFKQHNDSAAAKGEIAQLRALPQGLVHGRREVDAADHCRADRNHYDRSKYLRSGAAAGGGEGHPQNIQNKDGHTADLNSHTTR